MHRSLCGWSQTTWTLTEPAPCLKCDLKRFAILLVRVFSCRFIGFHSLKWKVSLIGMKKTGVSFNPLVKSINHQVKDFLCRDVEIGSLAQTVENQPKFFANSMEV